MIFFLSVIQQKKRDGEDESYLLDRIAEGDQESFAQLYDRYSGILFGLIRIIVRNNEIAEDLLQEIFLMIWERAGNFDPSKGSVYTWLVTLTRNKSIDKIRSKSFRMQQRHVSDENSMQVSRLVSNDESPYESVWNVEKTDIIKKALNKIPEKQREVIERAFFEGLSQAKIAEKYNIPLGTVKTRMRQGLEKLQVLLKNNEKVL